MMDKLLYKPKVLKKLTYSQFVKRYEGTKTVPEKYDFKEDMKSKLTQKDIDNEDYIFTREEPIEGGKGKKLPRYIPIEGTDGTQWMKLRRPLALRLHKFKKRENAHEYYYSEMQLYLPFGNKNELFPDDFE